MNNTVCGRCSVSKITQFRRCIFSKNICIFRHLKLEIALAIQMTKNTIETIQQDKGSANMGDFQPVEVAGRGSERG